MTHARISPAQAARLIADEHYESLDVRTQEEFALGHPQAAYNVPFLIETGGGRTQNPEFVRVVRATFALTDKLVVTCHTGARSQPAARALLAAGYTNVVEQRAGFAGARDAFGRLLEEGWQPAGFPCAATAAEGHDYAALLARATK